MRDVLTAALRDTLGALGVDAPAEIHLERPARREHGEFSTNVAMATAKAAGRNPRELAQQLADALTADPPRHHERGNLVDSPFAAARAAFVASRRVFLNGA